MAVSVDKLTKANDEAAITSAIKSLHKRSNSLQLDIHKVLVVIASRWQASGDIRPAVKHVNYLLQKGEFGAIRTNAIKAWVQEFFKFEVETEGDNAGQFKAGPLKHTGLEMKALMNHRWWEFKPEAPYKPMDFDKLFESLLNKGAQRAEDAKEEDNVDMGLIIHLRKAREEYAKKKVA